MKYPHSTSTEKLTKLLEEYYRIIAASIVFLPVGDMSYSYQVTCEAGKTYYLKLLDKKTQLPSIKRANDYLPLLQLFAENNVIDLSVKPISTVKDTLSAETEDIVCILFPWLEGDTLADSYPFSSEIVNEIACQVAKLHKATSSVIGKVQLPVEDFNLDFERHLVSCLNTLSAKQDLDCYGMDLAQLVLPREEEILSRLEMLRALKSSLQHTEEHVLCHGDLWGGNIIQTARGLYFIDWESAMYAPPEREMVGYITQCFTDFIMTYKKEMGIDFKPNIYLLKFYAFQAQLRNLTQWMMNILGSSHKEEQKKNDLEMIQDHCLDRWQWIENELHQYEDACL